MSIINYWSSNLFVKTRLLYESSRYFSTFFSNFYVKNRLLNEKIRYISEFWFSAMESLSVGGKKEKKPSNPKNIPHPR